MTVTERIEALGHLAYNGGEGDPQADVRWLLAVLTRVVEAVGDHGDRAAIVAVRSVLDGAA